MQGTEVSQGLSAHGCVVNQLILSKPFRVSALSRLGTFFDENCTHANHALYS
jgi:hypothetical protein